MKIEIITHFDKEDNDCSCDYYSVDVKIGGKIVRHYGDHYHEKGDICAEAFVDGYQFATGDTSTVLKTNKADGKQ